MRYLWVMFLVLPIASAQWIVSVNATPLSSELFVIATSPGCVYVLDGDVRGVYEFNGDFFVPLDNGNTICSQDNAVFRIILGPNAYVQLPSSDVILKNVVLSNVEWVSVSGRVFLSISPDVWPAFFVLFVGIVLLLAFGRRNETSRDIVSSVISYVVEHPGCTQKDICRALGLEKYQVSRILSRLEKEGRIVRIRRGISKRVYLPEQLQ